jgi:predicted ferric reductase
MHKRQLGGITIFGLVLVNVILYLIFPPANNGKPVFYNQFIGEILSSSAMVLMSCAFVLANRPRFLESFFGGLDQMYKAHKTAALTAIVLLFAHFFVIPLSDDPLSPGRLLGKTALVGLSILVLLTLAPRIPVVGGYVRLAYHNWRFTHKFIGLFFIVGFIHMLQVKTLSKDAPIPNLYWNFIAYVGMAAYLYKELLAPFLGRSHAFVVEAARKLNGSTLEVTLKPKGQRPKQTAGQFMFVSFPADKVLAESHPFTISSAPKEESLRLSIKASGDWTRHLYDKLQAGVEAKVDGCYGRLNYKTGGSHQIWIAGGIGVTPFLSWVRDLDGEPEHEIDFFYTVRAEADALFADEFVAASQRFKRFRAAINVSSKDGSLTADKVAAAIKGNVADRHIYMCGPLPMTEAFRKQFLQKGVPASNIHFEEFNFR